MESEVSVSRRFVKAQATLLGLLVDGHDSQADIQRAVQLSSLNILLRHGNLATIVLMCSYVFEGDSFRVYTHRWHTP